MASRECSLFHIEERMASIIPRFEPDGLCYMVNLGEQSLSYTPHQFEGFKKEIEEGMV